MHYYYFLIGKLLNTNQMGLDFLTQDLAFIMGRGSASWPIAHWRWHALIQNDKDHKLIDDR